MARYFEGFTDMPIGACAEVGEGDRLDQDLELALYWGVGADDERVALAGSRLGRFFHPSYRLSFHTFRAAEQAPLRYAMSGSGAALDAALEGASIPLDRPLTSDEQHRANLAVGRIIFQDLRAFALGSARENAVNMVVLEHVMAPELREYLFGSSEVRLTGFGISPALFEHAAAQDPEHDLWEMTGLDGQFTPTFLIGDADLDALPGSADNLVAHELGHALGLIHSGVPGNLMTPGQNRSCNEPLSSTQLNEIRGQLCSLHGAPCDVSTTESDTHASDLTPGAGRDLTRVASPAVEWAPLIVDAALSARRARLGVVQKIPIAGSN